MSQPRQLSSGAASHLAINTADGQARLPAAYPCPHPQVAFGAALAGSSEDYRPQQAVLRLTSRDSGAAAFFAAVRAKDGSMYATAKSADVQKQVGVPWMPAL